MASPTAAGGKTLVKLIGKAIPVSGDASQFFA
ncbi:MAG: hypothetical protein ACJAQU_000191 [Loktanella salsilacus]|jgi:hypothetical protein